MRVVIDTNVLLSAIIRPQGVVGPILVYLRQNAFTLLYTQALLEELVNVLSRPRFHHKYGITRSDIEIILRFILLRGQVIEITERIQACRDPKDDKFLEVAVSGEADLIVSGDKDLLVLNPFRRIQIITPAAFLSLLESTSNSGRTANQE